MYTTKKELVKEMKEIRAIKYKLAFKLDDIVIDALNKKELKKLIKANKKDIEIIKEQLENNPEEMIAGYKMLLNM